MHARNSRPQYEPRLATLYRRTPPHTSTSSSRTRKRKGRLVRPGARRHAVATGEMRARQQGISGTLAGAPPPIPAYRLSTSMVPWQPPVGVGGCWSKPCAGRRSPTSQLCRACAGSCSVSASRRVAERIERQIGPFPSTDASHWVRINIDFTKGTRPAIHSHIGKPANVRRKQSPRSLIGTESPRVSTG